jgi:DNA-binding response OmpR family regulator
LRILDCLRQHQYDVVILDTALPGLDGISVVRSYRAIGGSTPVLLVAGKHCSSEVQCGLDAGADAYLVKPFLLADLAAQVRALMRRPALRSGQMLRCGDMAMDTEAGVVTKNDLPIHLHPMEFKLLQFLMSHQNQVFNAHALFERVWQKDPGSLEDTVRTHVRALRKKLDSCEHASIITTVRERGYKVCLPQEAHSLPHVDFRTPPKTVPLELRRHALQLI